MNLENLKMTALLNGYAALKLPLIAFVTPRIMELSEERSVVRIRLGLRTRNHLGVMYFGALAMGAELSIALKAVQTIAVSRKRIDFIFKDFQAQFLKRADGHVHFVCDQAAEVADLIHRAAETSERLEHVFTGYAFVPSNSEEPVMKYQLTLSVRNRKPKT